MATYTPPPYFPQGSLAPSNKNRYRKFKLVMTLVVVLLVAVLAGLGIGVWYLLKTVF
jgi:predicted nucleic acid-binding Zn ribbon protein